MIQNKQHMSAATFILDSIDIHKVVVVVVAVAVAVVVGMCDREM